MNSMKPENRGGRLRRVIDLKKWDVHTAVGWVEDDFHHFGVTVEHDAGLVAGVRVNPMRYPWATCAEVSKPLQALCGQPLIKRASDIGLLVDMRLQCTHVYDLTGLVLAHISRGGDHRRYEVMVDDRDVLAWEGRFRPVLGPTHAALSKDGQPAMHWDIDSNRIIAPPLYAGHPLDTGFRAWTETMPEQEAEYATILRRAILVAGGRTIDHDLLANAAEMSQPALCYSFQPERREYAVRMTGQARNYEASADGMLGELGKKP